MTEKVKKNKWRLVFTIVTILAFLITLIALRKDIVHTLKELGHINVFALALILPIEFFNYYAQAEVYLAAYAHLKHKFNKWFLFRYSLELNFVQTIFPSGGISGLSYANIRMRGKGVSAAQATIVQLLKLISVFFSFLILLALSLIFLAIGGRANSFMILIASSLVTLLFVLTFAVIFIVGSEKRIDSFFIYITRLVNRFVNLFRASNNEVINIENARRVFRELHEAYLEYKKTPSVLIKPIAWGLLANITEVAAVYVVYIAYGHWPNPGAIIIAYAIANFGGVLSVLPGGIGVYETLMTLTLAAAGIPASLSIPVTITYRIVNISVQAIPGYFFYQKALIPDNKGI